MVFWLIYPNGRALRQISRYITTLIVTHKTRCNPLETVNTVFIHGFFLPSWNVSSFWLRRHFQCTPLLLVRFLVVASSHRISVYKLFIFNCARQPRRALSEADPASVFLNIFPSIFGSVIPSIMIIIIVIVTSTDIAQESLNGVIIWTWLC